MGVSVKVMGIIFEFYPNLLVPPCREPCEAKLKVLLPPTNPKWGKCRHVWSTFPVLLYSCFHKYFHRRISCTPILRCIFQVSGFYLTQTERHMGNAAKYITQELLHHGHYMNLSHQEKTVGWVMLSTSAHCVICILESTSFRLYQRFWIIPRGILSDCLGLHAISGKVCIAKDSMRA